MSSVDYLIDRRKEIKRAGLRTSISVSEQYARQVREICKKLGCTQGELVDAILSDTLPAIVKKVEAL